MVGRIGSGKSSRFTRACRGCVCKLWDLSVRLVNIREWSVRFVDSDNILPRMKFIACKQWLGGERVCSAFILNYDTVRFTYDW